MENTLPDRVRLGAFEVDLRAGELCQGGQRVFLREQPWFILRMLVERDGELVTRDEIKQKLWPNDTVVDFDQGINAAIRRLRQALGDSADEPTYLGTVARRGYRLLVPVEAILLHGAASCVTSEEKSRDEQTLPADTSGGYLIGKKVSHYRILELLGGGGMGVVYKAEDLKLGRRVAIKFLPSELASDPKALARLESEARAASALDHRNICSIYDLDEHEGQPFIVMQLLEGQTLQELMEADGQHGATMALAKVLAIGVQVAEGLQVAHDKGFIHRDIKPANIFITGSDEVKILDFGLAKSLQEHVEENRDDAVGHDAPSTANETASAHRLRLTMTGTQAGTAFYMSPEQVRGEKLDARTDIFSFGLVLYEMLSGQRAFPGNTTQVVHDGILNNTPAALRETIPASLVAIVDKCLEKERERRYQTAGEVSAVLKQAGKGALLVPTSSRRRRGLVVTGVVILVVACVVGLWSRRRPMAKSVFKNYRMAALTGSGTVAFAAISPDGRYLAYADEAGPKQSLWLQQVATSAPVRILGPVSGTLVEGLRFTPDGNYLYFLQADPDAIAQTLYRVAVFGGSPQKVASHVDDRSSVDIAPNGKQIVYSRRDLNRQYDLLIANADGSNERRILTLPDSVIARPVWSPDGQNIAFGSGEMNEIAVVSASGGPIRRILQGTRWVSGWEWLPDQSGLIVSTWTIGEDGFSLSILSYPDGKLRHITSDLASYSGVSLDHGGKSLVSVQTQVDCTLWVAPANDPSDAVPLHESAARQDGIWGVSWTLDGRLVFGIGDLSELWTVNRDGSNLQQLTHIGKTASNPSASSATDMIVFQRREPTAKNADIWTIDSQGNNLRELTSGSATKFRPDISHDGKWIVYSTPKGGPWKMSLSDGQVTLLNPPIGGMNATISPDGRWIAFEAVDNHIVLVAADGKTATRYLPFISEAQAPNPVFNFSFAFPVHWTATSDAITYVRTIDDVSNIWSQPLDGSPPKQLTHFNSMVIWSHSWSPDGKYLVMARGNLARDAVMLTDAR